MYPKNKQFRYTVRLFTKQKTAVPTASILNTTYAKSSDQVLSAHIAIFCIKSISLPITNYQLIGGPF